VEFWNLFALLLLLILALNNIKQRRILGNSGQLVGIVDVNRRQNRPDERFLPPGLLRPVTINCRCIPEDNNEVEQVLEKEKNYKKRFLGLVWLKHKYEQLAYEIKKKAKYMRGLRSSIYSFGMQYW